MPKTVLAGFRDVVSGLTKNTNRRTLQPIQDIANELTPSSKKMVNSDEKVALKKNLQTKVKQSKAVEKIIASEKENGPITRRSKRRTAATEPVNYKESPDPEADIIKAQPKNVKQKPKKPVLKPKKSKSTIKKTTEKNQTKLNFTPIPEEPIKIPKAVSEPVESEKEALVNSFSSAVTEDSGFGHFPGTSESQGTSTPLGNSIAVFNSPDIKSNPVTPYTENSILTIDSPPLSYWKDLAEQRRIALEKVLHENELLHDQMVVLEAENSQLKQLVREAEELAQVVKGIIQ